MTKPTLILYSPQIFACRCYDTVFQDQFETMITKSKVKFLEQIEQGQADAAVVCPCSAKDKDMEETLPLEAVGEVLPLLTCSEKIGADFVSRMAQRGVKGFITCQMEAEKISALIYEALKYGGLLEYMHTYYTAQIPSPHIDKMIPEIVRAFPRRLHESEMAQRLGISRRHLQRLCKQAFGVTYIRLIRRIWVRQALHLMQLSPMDNMEIALQLNYSEESNMARDFRKELDYSAGQARKLLIHYSPEELLHS